MKHKVRNIHFVGIGGVGMSGIAEVLHNLGYKVSGSDIAQSDTTNRLRQLGILIFIGHNVDNIGFADVIVVSTAINEHNEEVLAARSRGIPIIARAMMLAELMRFKYGIAIAGTHGKTTTTSLCAEVLGQCGIDPTFIIGGQLAVTKSNAKLGLGEYLVVEADESDASFLYLNPLIAVVTNIDLDHMNTYNYDENQLKQAFIDFLKRLPFYGCAILCNEDIRIQSILSSIKCPVLTYGLDEKSDIYAKNIENINGKMKFTLCAKCFNIDDYQLVLNLPGMHNVLNALAVIATSLECEGKIEDIAHGLANFHGVGRRCQHYGKLKLEGSVNSAILIDDYAHHPVELRVTIDALKNAYPQNRMIIIFQPHRYTRTRDLFDDFVSVLSNVDQVIILDVYSAGEQPIALADGKSLVRAIRLMGKKNTVFASNLLDVKPILKNIMQNNDLIVTMGAGSIGKLPQILLSNE